MKTLCVFCSSSNNLDAKYVQSADETGDLIVDQGCRLMWGGGRVGMMGRVADQVKRRGGEVIGVIPERLRAREVAFEGADEMIITTGMADRKTEMIERSDAFITLAGGMGTLDEVLEVITLRQLGYHDKPIWFVNTDGFYDTLLAFFDQLQQAGFLYQSERPMYEIVASPAALAKRIAAL
ncbi:LOG family protein [Acanthopleuribacter pedis]|uniref:Cytokinin riboside 5'-monophosphate phosphoribohydrolase n=1 Tax=Acanthopleuribacter pedis TaxID=442870 RepID=A0A8J7U4C6_9BACT|nr:TIGR00730 family Rossman fold protein [Acanthopleuribacter pedis]MBO1318141.1 TIGR00730 family Rossman fold protein [Acanthopleuribacter pedis]